MMDHEGMMAMGHDHEAMMEHEGMMTMEEHDHAAMEHHQSVTTTEEHDDHEAMEEDDQHDFMHFHNPRTIEKLRPHLVCAGLVEVTAEPFEGGHGPKNFIAVAEKPRS